MLKLSGLLLAVVLHGAMQWPDLAPTGMLRVLDDSFMITAQAIVVEKGHPARVAEISKFLAELRASGFLKASLERAKLEGVEVAPPR